MTSSVSGSVHFLDTFSTLSGIAIEHRVTASGGDPIVRLLSGSGSVLGSRKLDKDHRQRFQPADENFNRESRTENRAQGTDLDVEDVLPTPPYLATARYVVLKYKENSMPSASIGKRK